MAEPKPSNERLSDRPPPRPDPIPGIGRPEVSKGIFGDLFKLRRKKPKDADRAA